MLRSGVFLARAKKRPRIINKKLLPFHPFLSLEKVGTQKINLLHKAGGRVVYFGYKHQRKVEKKIFYFQRKVERGGQKRQKNTDVSS